MKVLTLHPIRTKIDQIILGIKHPEEHYDGEAQKKRKTIIKQQDYEQDTAHVALRSMN